ncbi:MAG TPA: GYD domain-containing protein [Stellaceae bacterium]|nr:GYD domain-containing protein [Stellaceae bacterium]
MATYIALCKYTTEGVKSVKDAPKRLDKAKALARKLGGKMKEFYLTMGAYDVIAVYDLPDDDAAATFALMIGRTGAVSTVTLRAFPEADYRRLVKALR